MDSNKNVNATRITLNTNDSDTDWNKNYTLSVTSLNGAVSDLNITKWNISIDTVAVLTRTYDETLTATTGTVTFSGLVNSEG